MKFRFFDRFQERPGESGLHQLLKFIGFCASSFSVSRTFDCSAKPEAESLKPAFLTSTKSKNPCAGPAFFPGSGATGTGLQRASLPTFYGPYRDAPASVRL